MCAFPEWGNDGTFRPKTIPTLPKDFLDKLNSRKYTSGISVPFRPTVELKIAPRNIPGIHLEGSEPKPFEPKFTPSLEGVGGINFVARQPLSVEPYTEEDVNKILDIVYTHTTNPNNNKRVRSNPKKSRATPHHATPKRCVDPKTERRARFVFGYMRELIRYVRITTAVNYVPENTVPPNVSHKMVTFVSTKIAKLVSSDPKLLGTRNYTKVRLYEKIHIPLVIAVRHRDELMRLRVAHKEVRADYADIMQRLDKRATVGVSLSVPAINRDILIYIERYGMPEEFLFDPQLMQGIKNETIG